GPSAGLRGPLLLSLSPGSLPQPWLFIDRRIPVITISAFYISDPGPRRSFDRDFCVRFITGTGNFGERSAQQMQALATARTDSNACDFTILVPLDPSTGSRRVYLFPHYDLRTAGVADFLYYPGHCILLPIELATS